MLADKILFAMLLSVLRKHLQLTQLVLETTEVSSDAAGTIRELKLIEVVIVNTTVWDNFERLRTDTTQLLELSDKFMTEILELYEPVNDFIAPWLEFSNSLVETPGLEEAELPGIYQQFLNNNHVRKISAMDISMLETKWRDMNLLQRSKECNEQLAILNGVDANFPPHLVVGPLLVSLWAKQDTVQKLHQQGFKFIMLTVEFRGKLESSGLFPARLPEVESLRRSFTEILEQCKNYEEQVEQALKYLKKVDVPANTLLLDETVLAELITRLMNDKNIQKVFEIDVEALETEWKELDLIQRAENGLAELETMKMYGDRVYHIIDEL